MHAHVRFVFEWRELFHLARLEAGAGFVIAFKVDIVAVGEREHLAVEVEACAAEHPLYTRFANDEKDVRCSS